MKIKRLINMQRLVGKVDNDFNISESDWIPRVAAWVIDALSQLKVLPMERKTRTLEVSDRLAQFPCELNAYEIRVFDANGNELSDGSLDKCDSGCNTTTEEGECGCKIERHTSLLRGGSGQEIAVIDNNYNKYNGSYDYMPVGTIVQDRGIASGNKKFWIQGNTIEVNFDTDTIKVQTYEVATYHDDYYDTEVPYIYDNGLLLEALEWYILFKYLSRGSKHPIYSLTSPNPYLNPAARWDALKNKAKTSVLKDMAKGQDDGWNNFFYNSTFLPRS